MAVRLSDLRFARTLPPGRFLVLISVTRRVDPRAIVRLEESKDFIVIRIRDFPACSIMPQQSTLPRAPIWPEKLVETTKTSFRKEINGTEV
jgi:hypothetical protein